MQLRYYFVDEAGDGNLFDGKGHSIVGTEGCSRYFILGMLDVINPDRLQHEMDDLRASLLQDPYFRGVPSMQPAARKTAVAFHAKDDVAEVRREVFALLRRHELRFFAVVRNKAKVVEYVRQRNQAEPGYRYQPNELYDYMVRRLFKNLLHKDDGYEVCFSRRGRGDSTEALRGALGRAREQFFQTWGIRGNAPITVLPRNPAEHAGLQAVDYFLWALQRFYERREDRYVELLWPAFHLVHDLDDTRRAHYGVYYTQKKPLSLAAIFGVPGI